jgi:hypothetical protein
LTHSSTCQATNIEINFIEKLSNKLLKKLPQKIHSINTVSIFTVGPEEKMISETVDSNQLNQKS